MDRKLFRILDANFNRVREALRVSEDLARFCLDDQKMTKEFKQCRHRVSQILLKFPVAYSDFLDSRESQKDVGKKGWIQDKQGKQQWCDLMVSNLKRAQEALRVLEEISKILASKQSPQFQRLRFRLYELENKCFRKF